MPRGSTPPFRSADDAVQVVRSGDRVYVGSNCGQPEVLCAALARQADRLRAVEVIHLIVFGEAPYVAPELAESFRHVALFVGPNTRQAVAERRADYLPVFLSDVPRLFRNGQLALDVALLSVSPPDAHGYVSLGVSVDLGLAAARHARHVIAEVNPNMPRTHGEGLLHISEIDTLVEVDRPLVEIFPEEPDDVSRAIAHHVAPQIPSGATLQVGIGRIPNAILEALREHEDLGIHTEMFSDGLIELMERGVVTGRRKTLHPRRVVASFCFGTRRLYDAIHDHPAFDFRPTEYVNDPWVIAQNDQMVAVNSAIEVDLTGQVVSDSIGDRFYSGIGGQVDFMRGAARSRGGKPMIALPSTAQNGSVSRIVSCLKPHAGVVTSRGDVHYVVTEYGVAYLHGRTVRDRALSLIRIAHPKFRDALLEEAKALGYVLPEQPSIGHTYPEHLVQPYTTPDGRRMVIRPILPTDDQALKHHFYSLSDDAKRKRFSRVLRELPDALFRDLVNIDYRTRMALVATYQDEQHGERIIGVARYFADEASGNVELGMAVRDDWQGLGIGRALVKALVAAAQADRWRHFVGHIDADNVPMIRLMQSLGLPYDMSHADGQVTIRVRLSGD